MTDIDDDNDGVPDADESPTCYYTSTEAGVLTKVSTGLASSTVNSVAVSAGNDIPTMHDGTSTSVAAGNHVVAAGQTTSTSSVIYTLEYPTPVRLSSISVVGATASWGTGSFAVLEGSVDGVTFNDALSAPVATSAGATKTWTVTLNTANYYQYYRIRVSTIGSTTPTFTNYEVTSVLNSSGYIPAAHPKPLCSNDTDGDGIINTLDLDSDGDGCYDKFEAGVTGATKNTNTYTDILTIPHNTAGDAGTNGLANSVETVADNAIINYSSTYNNYSIQNTLSLCTDTDGDGVGDLTDVDDDNDGILDRVECPGLFTNLAANGGLSPIASSLSNWYMGLTPSALPLASPFTPSAISISNNGSIYNYGGQPTYSGNSTITGGLFDMVDGVNTTGGVEFAMQEGDPQHPVVCQLSTPLVSGAQYSFAFDLGARTNSPSSTNKYVVLLYNATTGMTEKIIATDILSSLPGPAGAPAYKTISGTFIPNSSASYYLLFYPTISGGAGDDFTIDRGSARGQYCRCL